jgi:hypothetical protein
MWQPCVCLTLDFRSLYVHGQTWQLYMLQLYSIGFVAVGFLERLATP